MPGGHLAQCTAQISQMTSTWTNCETKQKEPEKDLLCGKCLWLYERRVMKEKRKKEKRKDVWKKKKIPSDGDSSTAALHLLVWHFKIIQGRQLVEVLSWKVSKRGLSVLWWHILFLFLKFHYWVLAELYICNGHWKFYKRISADKITLQIFPKTWEERIISSKTKQFIYWILRNYVSYKTSEENRDASHSVSGHGNKV